ncbi:MAG TPA: hypothetical protein H9906_00390 [Candidatus Paenalcaligenes intestinipullorum]|uniref:Uncharacterized protein n=1 Tax=Candidatus Paenalcaligenes intestinipullorum TaxID=2838718 RepID=A0A9D2U8C0_9BURK|nr:hypothetical protein [Candidatus Paenalcaligenes intestinipullorum]
MPSLVQILPAIPSSSSIPKITSWLGGWLRQRVPSATLPEAHLPCLETQAMLLDILIELDQLWMA